MGDGVSVNEMLSILEFQCVSLKNSPRRGPVSPAALLDEKPSEVWHRLAEEIASSIITWPKLRNAMADSVLPSLSESSRFDAGPDRAVLLFASQPANSQALSKSGSFRLLAVEAFARVFLQVFPADTAWTKTNYTATCAKIDGMGLSYFTEVDDLHGEYDEFVRKIFSALGRRAGNTVRNCSSNSTKPAQTRQNPYSNPRRTFLDFGTFVPEEQMCCVGTKRLGGGAPCIIFTIRCGGHRMGGVRDIARDG